MTDHLDRALAAHDLETELLGGCGICDTEHWEMCEACGKCRCETHESCTRPAPERPGAGDCPGVGEYGHGLTGKTVHWGCCPASR